MAMTLVPVLLMPVLLVPVLLVLGMTALAHRLLRRLLRTLHITTVAGMLHIATLLAAAAQQTVEQTHDAILLGRRVPRA